MLYDNLFRAFFNVLYDKLDKLVRQCQAVNSHLQISEACIFDIQVVMNQIQMVDNPESSRSPEIFLEGLKKVFHSYHKFKTFSTQQSL